MRRVSFLLGSPGAGACIPTATATRPTVVQVARTTTDASASWSITWSRTFVSTAPYVQAMPVTPGANNPTVCVVYTSTATGATGKCFVTVNTTLGGTLTAVLGTVISPVSSAGSNVDIRVIGREPTQ